MGGGGSIRIYCQERSGILPKIQAELDLVLKPKKESDVGAGKRMLGREGGKLYLQKASGGWEAAGWSLGGRPSRGNSIAKRKVRLGRPQSKGEGLEMSAREEGDTLSA